MDNPFIDVIASYSLPASSCRTRTLIDVTQTTILIYQSEMLDLSKRFTEN